MDDRQAASCLGKHRYESPAEAHAVAARYGITFYRCRYCNFWHIGITDRGRSSSAAWMRKRKGRRR